MLPRCFQKACSHYTNHQPERDQVKAGVNGRENITEHIDTVPTGVGWSFKYLWIRDNSLSLTWSLVVALDLTLVSSFNWQGHEVPRNLCGGASANDWTSQMSRAHWTPQFLWH